MNYKIENKYLEVEIADLGAELQSIVRKSDGKNLLWNGDKTYWGRRSPLLFPTIGVCKEGSYLYGGKEYEIGKHGFVKDRVFEVVRQEKDELWFGLKADEETKKSYPFAFALSVGYVLKNSRMRVYWKVENKGEETMYFSIGGHPAFNIPIDGSKRSENFLKFKGVEKLVSTAVNLEYCLIDEEKKDTIALIPDGKGNGYLALTGHLFDNDALLMENSQINEITYCTPEKKEYLTVSFETPIVGVWSMPGDDVPFVSIEPWYGRADGLSFNRKLEDKCCGNVLDAGATWQKFYEIEIHEEE